MTFVSSHATVKGYLEGDIVVLGRTLVGEASIIGRNVTLGYPSRKKIKSLVYMKSLDIRECDSLSEGSEIGEACIIRSGSVIYELAVVGDGVETGHNVLIREGSSVGQGSLIGSSTILDGKVNVGRNVSVQSNVYLPHMTVIEEGAFIAPNVCFTNDPYPQSKRLVGTVVHQKAIICANSTVLPGLKIGEAAVVGAGSVVTRDVPSDSVVVGNPARFLMSREDFDRKKEIWEGASL